MSVRDSEGSFTYRLYRTHLIERYCNMELKDYRRIFRPTDEAGQLDNLSRRFSWFRRILGLHEEEHGNVFPASWNVGKVLCAKFTEITA
jgi:vacuolar protein sorting-associated protein 53